MQLCIVSERRHHVFAFAIPPQIVHPLVPAINTSIAMLWLKQLSACDTGALPLTIINLFQSISFWSEEINRREGGSTVLPAQLIKRVLRAFSTQPFYQVTPQRTNKASKDWTAPVIVP